MSKLIGTNPNQVPSNADLGSAAFMDSKQFLLSKGSEISAIDAVISDAANDIFVYDTTMDSDGGAWRKRTQHTSWYNEELNTTRRGSRKEFPSIAIIVANTSGVVTIYDADDANLPMWMVFKTSDPIFGRSIAWSSISSCTMLNGILIMANPQSSAEGLLKVNFVSDDGFLYPITSYSEYGGAYVRGLATRSLSYDYSTADTKVLVQATVSDTAMSVLPNAPIDDSTGLPIPTIAVGTNGGVTVIKDNDDHINITAGSGSAYSGVSWVDITDNGNLIFEQDNSSNPRSVMCIPLPHSNRTTQTSDGNITDKVIMKWYNNGTHKPYPCINGGGAAEGIRMEGDAHALRSSSGDLTLIVPDLDNPEHGRVAYIASDHNTGWMVGDTKVSTLCDSVPGPLDTKNLVDNGNFSDGNINGWTSSGATIAYDSSGRLAVTASSGTNQPCYYPIKCVIGRRYFVSIDFEGSWSMHLGTGTNSANDVGYIPHEGTTGNVTRTMFFTATQTTHYVVPYQINGGTMYVDNVIVREAVADRSEYGNYNYGKKHTGFESRGTGLERTPVAPGADLVGYSGFGSGNYLRQPYNSELNFGTGDFSVSAWVKLPTTNNPTRGIICEREGASGFSWQFFQYNSRFYFYVGHTGSPAYTSQKYADYDSWYHVVAGVKGGKIFIHVNGELDIANSGSAQTTTITDAIMTVGTQTNGTSEPFGGGEIALLKISSEMPDAETIYKIYSDELRLFQPNAKATLYGTDNHVRSFAYDDKTKLLHLGTLEGRSDFQGLSRINNTTRAIASTMSAAGSMVVEE